MLELTKSICLILYFQISLGLRLYKLNPTEDDVIPRLKEILDTERSAQKTEYRKSSIFFKEKPNYRRANELSNSFLGKSILVSRIIPHGYHAGPYEYDSKLNTIYKPLVRFHVKKPIEDVQKEFQEPPKVLGYVLAIEKKAKENDILTQLSRIFNKKQNNRYGDMNSGSYLRTNEEVLSKLIDKSAEVFDALRPGGEYNHHIETEPAGPYVVIPEYPFWNYWTYSKTIHQDDCPGSLVKLGNVCIAPSGHRRYNLV